MLKKIAVVGGIVAVTGLGVGGAASAWSGAGQAQAVPAPAAALPTGSTSALAPAGSATAGPSTASSGSKAARHAGKGDRSRKDELLQRLTRVSHAQWVSKDARTGTFVTHDAVQGEVAAVVPGSITIKATDGTAETFVVTGSTRVRVHGTKGAATLTQVKVGDRAAVIGTGSGTMTATRVIDRGAPGTAHKTGSTKKSGTAKSGSTGSTPTTAAAPTS